MDKLEVERIITEAKGKGSTIAIIRAAGISYFDLKDYRVSFSDTTLTLSWWETLYEHIKEIIIEPVNLPHSIITFGSDPEFFYVKDGVVVPSTEVVKPNNNGVITDGFQAEMNPMANTCRYIAGINISRSLTVAHSMGKEVGAEISFAGSHVIDDKTWRRTPLQLRRFGCNPTLNAYNDKQKRVTGLREKFRAGGGHIHIGINGMTSDKKMEFVKLLDVMVGNTCVMFDTDPNQAIRRKNYGRAGEYREKAYGLEYRVPSNFWLKHYSLWSMVTGLVRNAKQLYDERLADELMSRIDIDKVREAINSNDKELAISNFTIIKDFFIEKHLLSESGLSYERLEKFFTWAKMKDPVSLVSSGSAAEIIGSWQRVSSSTGGFERTLQNISVK